MCVIRINTSTLRNSQLHTHVYICRHVFICTHVCVCLEPRMFGCKTFEEVDTRTQTTFSSLDRHLALPVQ